MNLRRTARRHQAATDPVLWWEHMPGDRVLTVEGFMGTVVAVEDGPVAGYEQYVVELDAGMGGGEYSSEELKGVSGSQKAASKEARKHIQVKWIDGSDDHLAEMVSERIGRSRGNFFIEQVRHIGGGYWDVVWITPEELVTEVGIPLVQANETNPSAYTDQPEVPAAPSEFDDEMGLMDDNPYLAVASEDYPELSEILVDRPPLAHAERVAKTADILGGGLPETMEDGRPASAVKLNSHRARDRVRQRGVDVESFYRNDFSGGYIYLVPTADLEKLDNIPGLQVMKRVDREAWSRTWGKKEIASSQVPVRIRRAAGYIVEDEDGQVVAGPFVSRLDAEEAERQARDEGQTNIVIRRTADVAQNLSSHTYRVTLPDGAVYNTTSTRDYQFSVAILTDENWQGTGMGWGVVQMAGRKDLADQYASKFRGLQGVVEVRIIPVDNPRPVADLEDVSTGTQKCPASGMRVYEALEKFPEGREPGLNYGSSFNFNCPACGAYVRQTRQGTIGVHKPGPKFASRKIGDAWWLDNLLYPLAEEMHKYQPEHLRYNPETGAGASFDWCRFRRNRRCYYPRQMNEEATQEAGYSVWVPEDRGFCPRDPWDGPLGQRECPVSEPGPNADPSEGPMADATIPWEQGGQRYHPSGKPVKVGINLDTSVEEMAETKDPKHEEFLDDLVEVVNTHRERKGNPYSDSNPYMGSIDPEFSFHFTATWRDVQAKAKRIQGDGHVRVISASPAYLVGEVRGDTNIYQTTLHHEPGSKKVALWECGCAWASYSWGRSGRWKKYEGRMCSHALALQYEGQSRGMFNQEITEDLDKPIWQSDPSITVKVPGDYKKPEIGNWRLDAKKAAPVTKCPECGGEQVYETWINDDGQGLDLRYVCPDCGGVFPPQVKVGSVFKKATPEQAAKLAEAVADWLPKWRAKQEAIGFSTNTVSPVTVLTEILGRDAYWFQDSDVKPTDAAIVAQVQYIVESGITPEELRRQAQELRDAVKLGAKSKGDVSWSLPKPGGGYYARPFAWTTRADSDSIEILGEMGMTWGQALASEYLLSQESRGVIQRFVDEGYGEQPISDFVRRLSALNDSPALTIGRDLLVDGTAPGDVFEVLVGMGAKTAVNILDQLMGRPKVAQADTEDGVMIALVPPQSILDQIVLDEEGAEPIENLHVTVAYLGKIDEIHRANLEQVVARWSERWDEMTGQLAGYGKFENGESDVLYISVDVPGLERARDDLIDLLAGVGIVPPDDHGFTPHLTLKYGEVEIPDGLPEGAKGEFTFDRATMAYGGEWLEFVFRKESVQKTAASLRVVKAKPANYELMDRSVYHTVRAQYYVLDENDVIRAYIRAEGKATYMDSPGWMVSVYTKEGMVGLQDPYTHKAPKGDFYASTLAEAKAKALVNVERFDSGTLAVKVKTDRPEPAREDACVLCGKPIKDIEQAKWIERDIGGLYVIDEDLPPEESLGTFPIGPDCYRRVKEMAKGLVSEGVGKHEAPTNAAEAESWLNWLREWKETFSLGPKEQLNRYLEQVDQALAGGWGPKVQVLIGVVIGLVSQMAPELMRAMGELKEEPEPALPSTTGEEEIEEEPEDPHAWLLEGSGKEDDMNIAEAARTYLAKTGMKDFTPAERRALIEEGEGVTAANLDRLDITGTHYEPLEDAFQMLDEEWDI